MVDRKSSATLTLTLSRDDRRLAGYADNTPRSASVREFIDPYRGYDLSCCDALPDEKFL
jgi:hypothetical protein